MKIKWNTLNVVISLLVLLIVAFVCGRISVDQFSDTRVLHGSDKSEAGSLSDRKFYRPERIQRPPRYSASHTNKNASERLSRMEQIIREANVFQRTKDMVAWISTLLPGEFSKAAEQFQQLGFTKTHAEEYKMLLSAWAGIDPLAALAHATSGVETGQASSTVLVAWSSKDPDAAITWAEAHSSNTEFSHQYMADVLLGLSQTDPERAADMIVKLFPDGVQSDVLFGLMSRLNADKAKDWIDQLPEAGLKHMAIAIHASNESRKNPQAAMDFIDQLPLGEPRISALESIIDLEMNRSPEAAARLIDTYKNDVTDNTIVDFLAQSLDKFPELALDRISYMRDENLKLSMYQTALIPWLQHDSKKAMEWMNKADLPESVRDFISQQKPK
jgi:hypothetical protein